MMPKRSRLKKMGKVDPKFPRSRFPDRLLLGNAKRKAWKFFNKYGSFEAYSNLSADMPEKDLTTAGEIDYDKVFMIYVETYYENPDMPV